MQLSIGTAVALVLLAATGASPAGTDHAPTELIGTWTGTSICTDREVAPACKDEVVVYEFSAGKEAATVHWKADKIVDGKRQPMGEMEVAYDAADACWKGEFVSARAHVVWCLAAEAEQLKGTAWLLPGKRTVRKVEAQKQRDAPPKP